MTGTQHTKLAPERKAARKNGVFRLVVALIAIIAEIALIVSIFTRLNGYSTWINLTTRVLAVLLVLFIYNGNINAAFKTPWIILILAVPIFGVIMFLMVGLNSHTIQMKKRYLNIDEKLYPMIDKNDNLIQAVKDKDSGAGAICSYLKHQAHFPTYKDTDIRYFGDTCEALDSMIADLKSAQHFIFMEYFAIDDKKAWHRIEEVLARKVKAGVEVRVFYDDLGSIGFINTAFSNPLAF